MNERIQELAEEAIKNVDAVHEGTPFNEDLAKMHIPDVFIDEFAKLIAQECVDILKTYRYNNGWVNDDHTSHPVIEISERFGLKWR